MPFAPLFIRGGCGMVVEKGIVPQDENQKNLRAQK
jgi:hypothetical protein